MSPAPLEAPKPSASFAQAQRERDDGGHAARGARDAHQPAFDGDGGQVRAGNRGLETEIPERERGRPPGKFAQDFAARNAQVPPRALRPRGGWPRPRRRAAARPRPVAPRGPPRKNLCDSTDLNEKWSFWILLAFRRSCFA